MALNKNFGDFEGVNILPQRSQRAQSKAMADIIEKREIDPLTEQIIAVAIEVHRILGPGLLESVCEEALCYELELRGMTIERQKEVDVIYKGKVIKGQRLDLVVNKERIVEVKSVRKLEDVFTAQLLSYLKCTGLKTGLLVNFGEKRLVDGIKCLSL